MSVSRRNLLSRGALLVASSLAVPSFLTRSALALAPSASGAVAANPALGKNILVVIQLSGGNDGINTLIPFGDPAYSGLRPTLAVAGQQTLPLTDQVGLHPNLAKLKGLYNQGKVAVIQGVGYPNPNRSHFRGMDIWHSARPEVFEQTGWLGRYLDGCNCESGGALPGISLGTQLNGMFWTETSPVAAVGSIPAFTFQTDTGYRNDRALQLKTLQSIYADAGTWSPYEAMIRRETVDALAGSDELQRVASAYQSSVVYPAGNGLATQLKTVAQVIAGNLETRLFSVQMGGFDTHANELNTQPVLLAQLAEAIDAFMQDLAAMGKQDEVAIMTFSEFGRRARENGSGGTDHGTAAPMFVIGNQVRGGLYGTYPSLGDLDANGDLKFSADFRSIYAGVLQNYLGADADAVLAGHFEPAALF